MWGTHLNIRTNLTNIWKTFIKNFALNQILQKNVCYWNQKKLKFFLFKVNVIRNFL